MEYCPIVGNTLLAEILHIAENKTYISDELGTVRGTEFLSLLKQLSYWGTEFLSLLKQLSYWGAELLKSSKLSMHKYV